MEHKKGHNSIKVSKAALQVFAFFLVLHAGFLQNPNLFD
jgi:hypothetical protein